VARLVAAMGTAAGTREKLASRSGHAGRKAGAVIKTLRPTGFMPATRYLIVNADDFGLSTGVNRGIVEAREHGIVTSASLMVKGAAATEAAAYAREHPSLSLGLHVDLGEWVFRERTWRTLYEVVDPNDPVAVQEEVKCQLARFRTLVGRHPTHLDSHQHVHRDEPLRAIFLDFSRALGVPLRHCTGAIRHCGAFYGQTKEGMPVYQGQSACLP
jgi:predicted glycoside hydrolase/deacetylase ChbG (UPF0249 family)